MFVLSLVFLALAVLVFAVSFFVMPAPTDPVEYRRLRNNNEVFLKTPLRAATLILGGLACLMFVFSMFTQVATSHQGVVKQFGQVVTDKGTLSEGLHMVWPWQNVIEVYTGIDTAEAKQSEAASKDTQKVHANLVLNYQVAASSVLPLYHLKPNLNYENEIVIPAMYEVFKAVVAKYTAEELITKREEVSGSVLTHLRDKLLPFGLTVANVAMTNFGFSQAFDAAIEQKVAASQNALTAERQKDTARFNAESAVLTAEGNAKAIKLNAEAIQRAGGEDYIRLEAIKKWDGKLPVTTAGGAVPFLNLK